LAADAADLKAVRQVELEHVYLQLQAAAEGLGVALASVPLIEGDVAAGRLVCPIAAPLLHAGHYELVTNEERIGTSVVRAFRDWIRMMVPAAIPPGS
jgi:LysR family transcriptional regulator, glycine cleavage system transcriptional activator